jgi:hypothetical protein
MTATRDSEGKTRRPSSEEEAAFFFLERGTQQGTDGARLMPRAPATEVAATGCFDLGWILGGT